MRSRNRSEDRARSGEGATFGWQQWSWREIAQKLDAQDAATSRTSEGWEEDARAAEPALEVHVSDLVERWSSMMEGEVRHVAAGGGRPVPVSPGEAATTPRALVLFDAPPVEGGEAMTARLLRHLAGQGRPVPVGTVSGSENDAPADALSEAGIRRFDLGASGLAAPMALGRLVRRLRQEGIEVLHAHGPEASILGAAAVALSPAKLVVTRYALDESREGAGQRARSDLALASLRRAEAVVTPSRSVARRLEASEGLAPDAVHVIPHTVDLAQFEPDRMKQSRAEVRRFLGLGERARLLLLPSVTGESEGHHHVVDVLPAVRRRVPNVRVLVAGEGEAEAELARRARVREVDDLVRFLDVRTDAPQILAAADLLVLPSTADASTSALMHAAAAGRPVVAPRDDDVSQIVDSGRTGMLVPSAHAGALCEGIARLLENGGLASRFGLAARARAERCFDVRQVAERTLDLWSDVAGDGRAA